MLWSSGSWWWCIARSDLRLNRKLLRQLDIGKRPRRRTSKLASLGLLALQPAVFINIHYASSSTDRSYPAYFSTSYRCRPSGQLARGNRRPKTSRKDQTMPPPGLQPPLPNRWTYRYYFLRAQSIKANNHRLNHNLYEPKKTVWLDNAGFVWKMRTQV